MIFYVLPRIARQLKSELDVPLVEVTEYSTMLQDSFGQLLICACCYLSACCAEPHLRIQMGLASFSHL